MITREELQREAARAGVRVDLQERDYVLGWFLLGLARTPGEGQAWAFKGGTALRKMYFPTYRFSEDLDFTLVRPIGENELQASVAAVCRQAAEMSGVRMQVAYWKQTRSVAREEAYLTRVAYVGPLGQRASQPPRITLDLTFYEQLVLDLVPRSVVHPYSDAPAKPHLVRTYRLEEMLAEKLRALLGRSYPRDLYDIWYLLKYQGDQLDHTILLSTLEAKCRYKGYAFSSVEDFVRPARRADLARAWDTSLRHLLPIALPPYESVVAELSALLGEWLPPA